MQFALSQEQILLREAVFAFVRDHYSDGQRRKYRELAAGYSDENWRLLGQIGVLGLLLPSNAGGAGAGPKDLITVMEVLGGALAVEPVLEEIIVAANLLAKAGSAAQKSAWLDKVMDGSAHLTLAHFEHGARFQLGHVRLQARVHGERTILDGTKSMVTLAAAADQWIVSAVGDAGSADPSAIGFHLVSPTARGVERRDYRLVDGSIASMIEFRAVESNGRLPGGYDHLASIADTARLAAGAEMVGIMSTLFSTTVEYLKNRTQFGAKLASFQALQHRLADLYVLLEQSRSQLHRAAACIGNGVAGQRGVAGMKSYISRAAITIGEECVHLHGGIGMTDDLALGHGYKRLVLLANLFGDADAELTRFNRLAG